MGYKDIIITAIVIFPFIALFFTIPFVLFNYHKYGAIPWLRTMIVYSFILYLITAYFLIILPLPSIEEVSTLTTATMQLIPFNFIRDIITHTAFRINDFSTYLIFFKEQWVYQVIYNIFLTVPFGIFLRYYFKKDFKTTCFFTFLLSLFFELTQLSGLYFIYPRAYRLFDVDDLIVNTFGGVVGYLITPLICFILPSRDKLDTISYKKGAKVSFTKRLVSFIIDSCVCSIILFIVDLVISLFNLSLNDNLLWIIVTATYFILFEILFKGQTIGKKITKIKIVSKDGTDAKFYKYILRYLFFIVEYLFIFSGLFVTLLDISLDENIMAIIILIYLFILMMAFVLFIIRNLIMHKPFVYENLSFTKVISTIKVPDKEIIDTKKETDVK